MTQYNAIPTNIITGFLGVGKTTALNQLLKQKPDNEVWAVLVNEFGQIGVDQTMLPAEEGLHIRELAGGCICCALGPSLPITLTMLIRRSNPDRLIIEPTGLGHPEGIIDVLQGISFKDVLDLRATVCLLDPRAFEQPEVMASETFQDQINLADVVVINKCDLAEPGLIDKADKLLSGLFPPKQQILRAEQAKIPLEVLDLVRDGQLNAQFPQAHATQNATIPPVHQAAPSRLPQPVPLPNKPIRKLGEGQGMISCGWIFHRDDTFNYDALCEMLNSINDVQRIKGAFCIGYAWVAYNRVLEDHNISKLAYRRDSRLEIITSQPLNWTQVEQQLLACLQVDQSE
ncbi:MAG: CobW family GTP-binding protein [Pontibacterium sp.]